MVLLILSFIAGVLTVAAPCVLPLLPVIIGGSVVEASKDKPERQWLRPVIITASLAASVTVFTLLLKTTTVLLGVPQIVWQVLSGSIVVLLGLNYLWPHVWYRLAAGSFIRSNALVSKAHRQGGLGGAILLGAALGPVFSSCSPTYALIVATVLPVSFLQGFLYLAAYAVGMSATLLLIAYFGQTVVKRLRWISNPGGWFRKSIGILFLLVGVAVILGFDKEIQAYVLEQGWYDPISGLEKTLMN
jgi:cytochrome c-type biogenesis protein